MLPLPRRPLLLLLLLTLPLLRPGLAPAQAPGRAGAAGLWGEYYAGRSFERRALRRADPTLDFTWRGSSPGGSVPAEDFSARWTGWLLPPATGRYVLHISVDDGARLWLDGRLVLDEWRGQPLSFYQVPVRLVAGRPVAVRLDYCQYSRDARLRLAWARPDQPPAPATWRNGWGLTSRDPAPETIPSRYLTYRLPALPPPPAAVASAAAAAAPAARPPAPAPRPARPPVVSRRVAAAPPPRPAAPLRPPRQPAAVAPLATAAPIPPLPTAPPPGGAAQLAAGRSLTLRNLYFAQGRAELPAAARASLDSVRAVLAAHPALRLEVQGHTDNQGDSTLNRDLSRRRAAAVCAYLAGQGVAPERLLPVGLGGTRPVADNRQPAQRPRNRRVVFRPLL